MQTKILHDPKETHCIRFTDFVSVSAAIKGGFKVPRATRHEKRYGKRNALYLSTEKGL